MSATPSPDAGCSEADGSTKGVDPRVARSRQKLIDAATALLVESGPAAVTVDAVAERSGVAKSTLYRHWPSRNELLLAVLRANVPSLGAPDLSVGFETALHALLSTVADTFTDPEWARILPALLALRQHQPELTELFDADHQAQLCVLGSVLDVGVAEGRLPADIDVQVAADLLIGPLLFVTLVGDHDRVHELARHSAERFIASYAGLADVGRRTAAARPAASRPRRTS